MPGEKYSICHSVQSALGKQSLLLHSSSLFPSPGKGTENRLQTDFRFFLFPCRILLFLSEKIPLFPLPIVQRKKQNVERLTAHLIKSPFIHIGPICSPEASLPAESILESKELTALSPSFSTFWRMLGKVNGQNL